jgi:hypothetical protein
MRLRRWALRASLLTVLCAGLVPALATGSASALTRGFDIYNLTGQALTVSHLEISGNRPQFAGAELQKGSVLAPGEKVHVELHRGFGLLENRELTVRYSPLSAPPDSPSSPRRFFQMTLESSSGNADCFAPRYAGGSQQCDVTGNAIRMLDSPGTVHTLDPNQGGGPLAATVMATLCRSGTGASCEYKPEQKSDTTPDLHAHGAPVYASWGTELTCPANSSTESPGLTDPHKQFFVEYTGKSQNSLEAGFRYGFDGKLLRELAARAVRAAYGRAWTDELRLPANTLSRQMITGIVPGGDIGWGAATFPFVRYTGDYVIRLANTEWRIPHVTWEVPDPDRADDTDHNWIVQTRPATREERYACDELDPIESDRSPAEALTITKRGNGSHNVLRGGAESNVLLGRGGNDILVGGGGNNRLVGGTGRDALFANSANGTDILNGGPGADTMIAKGRAIVRTGRRTGRGWDYVYVRDGRADDTVYCQSRRTIVYADKGDRIRGRCGRVIRTGPINQPRPLM